MVEAVADLKLPSRADRRLQDLMDRNNNGALTPEEQDELESWVELSETIALVRAQALRVLNRTQQRLHPYRERRDCLRGQVGLCISRIARGNEAPL